MANANSICLSKLLGAHVQVLEPFNGAVVEHLGTIVGVVQVLPGSGVGEAILIEKPDNTLTEWLHLDGLTINVFH